MVTQDATTRVGDGTDAGWIKQSSEDGLLGDPGWMGPCPRLLPSLDTSSTLNVRFYASCTVNRVHVKEHGLICGEGEGDASTSWVVPRPPPLIPPLGPSNWVQVTESGLLVGVPTGTAAFVVAVHLVWDGLHLDASLTQTAQPYHLRGPGETSTSWVVPRPPPLIPPRLFVALHSEAVELKSANESLKPYTPHRGRGRGRGATGSSRGTAAGRGGPPPPLPAAVPSSDGADSIARRAARRRRAVTSAGSSAPMDFELGAAVGRE